MVLGHLDRRGRGHHGGGGGRGIGHGDDHPCVHPRRVWALTPRSKACASGRRSPAARGHAFTPPRARRGSAPRSDGPSRRHGAHSERTCEIFEVACGPRDDDVVPGLPQHSRRLRQTRTGKTLHLLGAPLEVLERRLDVTERRRDRGIRARARGGRGDRLGRICQTVRPPEQVGRIPGAPRTIRSLGSLCDTDSSRERGHAGNRATASLAPVSGARCTSRVWRSRVHERVRCQALPLIYTPGPIVRVRFRPEPVRV
jgi:hypothetical protein